MSKVTVLNKRTKETFIGNHIYIDNKEIVLVYNPSLLDKGFAVIDTALDDPGELIQKAVEAGAKAFAASLGVKGTHHLKGPSTTFGKRLSENIDNRRKTVWSQDIKYLRFGDLECSDTEGKIYIGRNITIQFESNKEAKEFFEKMKKKI